MDDLALALRRFDLPKYLEQHGVVGTNNQEWLLRCPACHKEKLSVNIATRLWRCFVCERQIGHRRVGAGDVFSLIKWLDDAPNSQAARTVFAHQREFHQNQEHLPETPRQTPQSTSTVTARTPTNLPDGTIRIDGILPYMRQRGITFEDAQQFGLGVCHSGWVANRLIFPVWKGGKCIYWQARAMWEKDEHEKLYPGTRYRKTLNPPVNFCSACKLPFPDGRKSCALCNAPQQYGSADVLWNLEQASQHPRVAICEGPTSAIRTGVSAVCTFGKVLHPAQVTALLEAKVKAVDFMWDGPSPTEPDGAIPEMLKAAAMLSPLMDVRLVLLPQGDPGDYPREDLHKFRAQAKPLHTLQSNSL